MSARDRARRYGANAIDNLVREVASAARGTRNVGLCPSLRRAIELCNALPSTLSRFAVLERITDAAIASGLSPSEVRSAIRSAAAYVGDRPAKLPPGIRDDGEGLPAPSFASTLSRASRIGRQPRAQTGTHNRPPRDEVHALWSACEALAPEVLTTLSGKQRGNIDPTNVIKRPLARWRPDGVPLPPWAQCWPLSHRVVAPLFDATGELVSLRARAAGHPGRFPKELGAKGFEVRGTVMANPIARDLLRGDEFTRDYVQHVGVVLVEGCPSWLAWSSRWLPTFESEPAAFGYFASGWTQAHADRIPEGTTVLVDWDANPAGERMRDKILATLGHCEARVTAERRAA